VWSQPVRMPEKCGWKIACRMKFLRSSSRSAGLPKAVRQELLVVAAQFG
jgi:hypothetical protein